MIDREKMREVIARKRFGRCQSCAEREHECADEWCNCPRLKCADAQQRVSDSLRVKP